MAAAKDSGYGLGAQEEMKTVDTDEVKRQVPKIVSTVAVEGGEEVKNGSEACPEGAGSDKCEDEQVAKKPRVEKAENGENGEKAGSGGYGVESLDGIVDKDGGDDENGEGGGEGEEVENGVVGAGEEAVEGVPGKDAAPGDVGLRTLLQEGENTKTSAANHGADATHMLNGAK